MKKIASLLCLFILLVTIQPVQAKEIQLFSKYYYLYDRSNEMVYLDEKSDEKIYPASMTKILTVSLALDKIPDIHQKVTITSQDIDGLLALQATTAGFYVGEQVTYEDLLYGALLPSGADACLALSRLTYGSTKQMVAAMNQKVKSLGLTHSHFQNVTGLHDDNHYTTVKDMAQILNHALSNKEFVKVFNAREYTSSSNHHWISSLQRGKEYKGIDVSHIDGGKSGFTDEAQLTFASTMTIDHHQLILVTAYAKGQHSQNHVKDAVHVCDYMTKNFYEIVLYKKDETIQDYWIFPSFQFQYHYPAYQDISLLVSRDISKNDLKFEVEGKNYLLLPQHKNQQIGKLKVQYQQKTIYEYPLILTHDIQSSMMDTIGIYGILICIPVALVGIIVTIKRKKDKHD
ncbi:D-alanyl-D-alanine carboxypeptidase family protein [Longibaculum muris]|uniref:D-alanyl-D-alanine carboxypeptidase family protein n=1 Tax=Longibaculum muris TaxID=1796628 RepID=UPI0012B8D1DA|nr:D-alanyl-D-alanine carboxypeptidase family protein [Longibaculum muris]